MMIFVVGLVFAVAGVVGTRQNRQLTRHGQRVTGTVTDLQWRVTGDGGGGFVRDYKVMLEFQTLDGQPVQTVTSMGRKRPVARPGDRVPVIYDPRRPTRAEIDTPAGRMTWLPVLFAVAGLAAIGFGVYWLATGHS